MRTSHSWKSSKKRQYENTQTWKKRMTDNQNKRKGKDTGSSWRKPDCKELNMDDRRKTAVNGREEIGQTGQQRKKICPDTSRLEERLDRQRTNGAGSST